MAVEGFEIIDSVSKTSTGGVDIFDTDITINGPVGVAIELQIQIYSDTTSIISVIKNSVTFGINNGATIQGVINFTMLCIAGDVLNFQTSAASAITIFVVGGGAG